MNPLVKILAASRLSTDLELPRVDVQIWHPHC